MPKYIAEWWWWCDEFVLISKDLILKTHGDADPYFCIRSISACMGVINSMVKIRLKFVMLVCYVDIAYSKSL